MGHSATGSHGGHDHPPHLQHHFDTPVQQFESGKLGMWLFLATEILLFAGLFCAYAVYRANHPEIFMYAHLYLDKTLGGINTVVLLCSSLTMAWAVRAAQLGKRKLLVTLLSLTILGGFGFMGIKYVEYKHKWEEGLLWGRNFEPVHAPGEAPGHDDEHGSETAPPAGPEGGEGEPGGGEPEAAAPAAGAVEETANAAAELGLPESLKVEPTKVPDAPAGPAGTVPQDTEADHGHETPERPSNVHVFFGVYFAMTGLHGLHVIAGILAIAWVLRRSLKGVFGPQYYTPVDLVGLYWHLVDLIWIFLFPLLYLIH